MPLHQKKHFTRAEILAVTDEQASTVRCPNSDCNGTSQNYSVKDRFVYRHCSKWMNQSCGHRDVPTHYRRKQAYLIATANQAQ